MAGRMPNFYVIGAAKAGTTALYEYLRQHDEVYLPFRKEVMFFSKEELFERGKEWYLTSFFQNTEDYPARGEVCPHYLYWSEKVVPRLRRVYRDSEVKFIVILRDPVDRAYSWYWNMVREGVECLSFRDALLAEDERLADLKERLYAEGSMDYGYYKGSCYASRLKPYIEEFGNDRFLFLFQEELRNNLDFVMENLFGFLGVDSSVKITMLASNAAALPRSEVIHKLLRERSLLKEMMKPFFPYPMRYKVQRALLNLNMRKIAYPHVDDSTREYLRNRFREEIRDLEKTVGRDLSVWLGA